MLQYAQAKGAFDRAKDEEALKPWQGSELMALVTRNTFDLRKARMAKRRTEVLP